MLPAGGADAVALWAFHAHAHDTADISPILTITSPAPECGKTTLLLLLGALTPKPPPFSNITAAALFRAVEKWRPTMLVDEADTFLRDSDELRGIINSGHNRGAAFVIRTTGDDHEPRCFMTWAPKVIALIGKLAPTLTSRSIHIEMRRLGPGETVDPIRVDLGFGHLKPLTRQAARWTHDHDAALRAAEPDMPAVLIGRRADNWRCLLAIADVAGGDWPERARRAAEALSAERSDETAAVLLLEDIRKVFNDHSADRLPSTTLCEALVGLEHRPWPEWGRSGRPISTRGLAKLLKPFDIIPGTKREGADTFKGYTLQSFDDAFSRYLPPIYPSHRHNPQETAILDDPQPSHLDLVVTVGNDEKAKETATCDGVTVGIGETPADGQDEVAEWTA